MELPLDNTHELHGRSLFVQTRLRGMFPVLFRNQSSYEETADSIALKILNSVLSKNVGAILDAYIGAGLIEHPIYP